MPSFPNDANLRAKMAKINPLAKTPQNGDVLAYNNSTKKFEPKTPELSSIKLTDDLTDGDALVYDEANNCWKNAASAGGVSCLLKVTCTPGATVIIEDTTNGKEFFRGVIESGAKDFAVRLEHSYTLHQEKDAEVSRNKTVKITNLIHSVRLAFITKYAVHIDTNNASASSSASYPDGYDNSGFTPAKMEADGSKFNWGSWENAFFLPRSCMLKSNGTVDYYLNETDPTRKADGSASDVANTAYDGNAMMEWGDIWFGFFPDSKGEGYTFVVANREDDGLYDYCNIAKDLTRKDHFYTPKYFGSLINGKCRSLSGQTCINKTTRSAERGYAEANGTGWSTESFGERQLINHLLVLMAKTLDTQGAYGNGNCNAGSAQKTGTTDSKKTGLFYGTTANKTEGMRVFGMENYWGNMWRAIEGWVTDASGYNLVKMCYGTADGTTENNYSESGTGYIQRIKTTGTSGSEISKMSVVVKTGVIPETIDGETINLNKYFCDGHWTGSGTYAIVGGDWNYGLLCGAFCSNLSSAPGYAGTGVGCAVSYR